MPSATARAIMPGSTLRRRVICHSFFLLYRLLGVDLRPQLCDGHVERLQVRLQALDLLLSFLQDFQSPTRLPLARSRQLRLARTNNF
jgi:hypothetical protein